jgi:protein TonB
LLSARTPDGKYAKRFALAAILALHAVAIAVFVNDAPVRTARADATPVVVTLIPSPPVLQPPEPARPLPVQRSARTANPRPVQLAPLAALALAPMAAVAIEVPAREALAPLPPIQIASAPAAEAEPPPTTPPSYGAAYLHNPPPVYPPLSKRAGEQGKVILRVLVTAHGVAETVAIGTTSGSQRLDEAAVETVKRWRFLPARQGDHAVAAWVLVPIAFILSS